MSIQTSNARGKGFYVLKRAFCIQPAGSGHLPRVIEQVTQRVYETP